MGGPAGGESCWLGSTPDHEQVAGQGLHEGEAGRVRGLRKGLNWPLRSAFPSQMSQEEEDGH